MHSKGFSVGSMMIGMPPMSGHVFSFTKSLYGDGVNDVAKTSSPSSTAFNPFGTSAWSFSAWIKPTATATMDLFGVHDGSSDRFFFRLNSNRQISVGSHGQVSHSGVSYSAGNINTWHMYSVSIEVTSPTSNTVRMYIDGVLFATIVKAKYTYSVANTNISIGAVYGGTGGLQGYMTQAVFTENLVPASEWVDLYNGGDGADPSKVITSPHSIYNINGAVGATTGTITDALGQQDLTMSGYLSPFGINADIP
jgi:hypothetical protein